jgi:hypothetical protein
MIYELRTYHSAPKRLSELVRRFQDHTVQVFERLGIRHIGFWTVVIGEANDQLIYLLQWDSLAQREELWAKFLADPEWQRIWAETDKNGPLNLYTSNQILQPTSFSRLQ